MSVGVSSHAKLPLNAVEIEQIIRYVPSCVSVLDKEMRYLMVSDRWIKEYNIAEHDIIGKCHYDVLPDIPERWREVHRRCMAGAIETSNLDKFERENGEIVWVRWAVLPWHKGNNEIAGIVILTEVVNQQMSLAEQLKESEARYAFATSAGEIGIWDWDVSTNYLIWDSMMHQLYDMRIEDFHRSYDDFICCVHREDRERVRHQIDLAIRGARYFDSTFRVIWRDGSTHSIHSKAQVYRDKNGNLVRMTGVCYDITASVESSQKLKRTVEELQTAQNKLVNYSVVLEGVLEGVSQVDKNGYYIYTNDAYNTINGYGASELIGKRLETTILPEDLPIFNGALRIMIKTGKATTQLRGVKQDDKIFYKRVTLIAFYDELERFDGHYCIIQDITEEKKAAEQLEKLALYDTLTKLPNRAHFFIKLKELLSVNEKRFKDFAVLFLDINNFKRVNDCFGHHQGDIFLKKITKKFKAVLGEREFLARLGGDEFVVVLRDVVDAGYIEKVANALVEALVPVIYLDGKEVYTSVSIGITVCRDISETAKSIVQQADMAMYRAKNREESHVCFYSLALKQENEEASQLEQHLKRAIEKEELTLVFQPQVQLYDQKLIGFEVLLRWHNPLLGEVSPEKFISVAEKIGLIHELGAWVAMNSIKVFSGWRRRLPDLLRDVKLSINCSSLQLNKASIAATILDSLQKHHLPGKFIIIEITETRLMKNFKNALDQLQVLEDAGVQIAIDDFGKGYSSLNYIKHLPIKYLKIDQGFVSDITDKTQDGRLAEAIIGMANALNLVVIAEGVENYEQYAFLLKKRCHLGQGNFIHKPIRQDEVEAYLEETGMHCVE